MVHRPLGAQFLLNRQTHLHSGTCCSSRSIPWASLVFHTRHSLTTTGSSLILFSLPGMVFLPLLAQLTLPWPQSTPSIISTRKLPITSLVTSMHPTIDSLGTVTISLLRRVTWVVTVLWLMLVCPSKLHEDNFCFIFVQFPPWQLAEFWLLVHTR